MPLSCPRLQVEASYDVANNAPPGGASTNDGGSGPQRNFGCRFGSRGREPFVENHKTRGHLSRFLNGNILVVAILVKTAQFLDSFVANLHDLIVRPTTLVLEGRKRAGLA